MLLSATFLPPKFVFYVTELRSLKMFNSENVSSTMVSVVVSIKNGKGKGHLSSPKTLLFPLHFPRGMFSVSAYHGAGLWLPVSKGWMLALQGYCSRLLLLGSWLASCTQTQPDLCIVCGSSSRSLWTRQPSQEGFGFLFQSLKTTLTQGCLVTHACPSLELGHLLFLMNLVVVFGQLWILPSCCSPYHESQAASTVLETSHVLVILHILPTLRRPPKGSQLLLFLPCSKFLVIRKDN